MDGRGARKGLPEILCIGMAVLLLAFFAGEADLNSAAAPPGRTAREAAGFTAALLLSFAAIRFGKRIRAGKATAFFGNDRRNLILLAAAALLPRLAWLVSAPPRVISDYGLYVRLGTEYAKTGAIERDVYLLAVAPGAPVFGVLLGAVMRIFGTGEGTAVAFCLTLNV